MAFAPWQLCFVVFPAIAILHLHVSPYTKVEESFNIQAIHDILEYGVPMSDAKFKFKQYFDHMTFSGAVPRTFIGSLMLAGLAKPEIWLGDLNGMAAQTHVRAVLGGMNATAMALFARSIERAYGSTAASWYVVLQASQFHLWYYASRTLPNMFAFFLSTIALAYLLPNPTSSLGPVKRTRLGLYLMTIATVIFRSELALLLGARCLWLLIKPQTLDAKFKLIRSTFIPSIIPGAILALVLTVAIDSYFWQSPDPLWPELSAFASNIFPKGDSLGASAWGTQPFYWYLISALPRLLMNQIFMIDLFFTSPSTLNDVRILDNLIPSYAYLLLYSLLSHKEIRFMFPIVPSLTLIAALTCTRFTINAHKSMMTKLLLLAAIVSTIITAFVSHAILLPLSAQNYPGGLALEALHQHYQISLENDMSNSASRRLRPEVHVHLTNLALQSGVTRFLEQPPESAFMGNKAPLLRTTRIESGDVEELDPIILPGDANHPALTIRPKPPIPSASTSSNHNSYQRTSWVYDKSSNNTDFHEHTFWNRFDFAVVEDPTEVIGAWNIVQEVKALGRPRLLKPNENRGLRYQMWEGWTTPDELWTYWTTPDKVDVEQGTTALLHAMYPSTVSSPLAKIHNLVHDVFRLGKHSPVGSITQGYWLDLPLVTKLYILERDNVGALPSSSPKSTPRRFGTDSSASATKIIDTGDEKPLELPDIASNNEMPLDMDKLGPLVVNKDGTLSRLDNWQQMNQQERKRTIQYLKQRNMLRLENVQAAVA